MIRSLLGCQVWPAIVVEGHVIPAEFEVADIVANSWVDYPRG